MSHLASSIPTFRSTEVIGQGDESIRQSPRTPSIHILDDDSLLNIFYLYRPAIFDKQSGDHARIEVERGWDDEQWWYKLAHVCRRWRTLILASASYLDVCLVCTNGTPVADMLANSPPLPLIINFPNRYRDITAEEEGIILALEQRDRVRRIRLRTPLPNLRKLIMAIDEEFPVLEYLIVSPPIEDTSMVLRLPETFQAPHLRHLVLAGFALPMGSRLLATAVGLVSFGLVVEHPSAYFRPNILLQWLSFMPQLETLQIYFFFPVPNRDVERQLMNAPIMTHVTLSNLRLFRFKGVSAYMEAVVRRIITPRLKYLDIQLFKQLTYSVPHLMQFINTTENLRFDSAIFQFSGDGVEVKLYPREEAWMGLLVKISCLHLDWQASSVAQIFTSLAPISSSVEHLTLKHEVHGQSSEEHNEVDRTEWHNLLRSFSNVKTLRADDGLVEELSRCLRLDDGELPVELLPELQELTYSGRGDTGDAFKSFLDVRQNAGRPVALIVDRGD